MNKRIVLDFEARKKVIEGIDKAADCVKSTLGPKGRVVVMGKSFGSPRVTKDGVTVAKEIELSDELHKIGSGFIKEVASKTVDAAGDGTTTACVILQSLVNNGLKVVEAGMNSVEITKGMNHASKKIIDYLNDIAIPVKGNSDHIKQVATISANGEEEIGKLIAEAVGKIGNEGIISVDDGKSIQTELNVVEGMELDRGFVSPHFANTEKQTCELENPYVLIYDKKISSLANILPLLENVVKSSRSLLIIAEDVDGIALNTLVVNSLNKIMKVCVIKSPGFGDRRKEICEDIAVLTGGSFISEEMGKSLEETTVEHLGQTEKIIITKDKTTIIGGKGSENEIKTRYELIKSNISDASSDYDKEKLEERKSKLMNGVAVISVGGVTESEQKERKDRVEDAVQAVKAAIEEGILPGGGSALIHASKNLNNVSGSQAFKAGVEIVKKAILSPLNQNLINAGHDDSAVIIDQIKKSDDIQFGYDVLNEGYGNMMELGIVDPKKSTRSALQYAVSVATLVLTMGAAIVDEEDDKNSSANNMGGGMPPMGGMY
ncbi:chaperonin GroEL [Candidatus Cytomitobacter indipagum]|uniref:60 kDa chaperonin n=1 Tax=Candidatus Cytomitobacter indipagum TaxID=2601575 RepID=A0A5C0UG28_9PROT|nr:chaperonin GroEL [Candidatus Cytomitobacter indipagum]QEK37994.1 chaperonin GroEL [Candidatus Cytomitobacter indipagum]